MATEKSEIQKAHHGLMKKSIQKTLDGKLTGYYGLNAFGEEIYIPNFQPLPYDDNPRLDQENIKGKRKNNK